MTANPKSKSDNKSLSPLKKGKKRKAIKEELISLAWIILAVLCVRAFIIEPYKIPSASMVPTLLEGDHIFVTKFAYSLGIPFTKIKLIKIGQPKRGDIAVFLYPADESLNFVKRIVALPGDTVEVKDRVVFVNDYPLMTTEMPQDLVMAAARLKNRNPFQKLYWETYPRVEGFSDDNTNFDGHFILADESSPNIFNRYYEKIKVPQGNYFVMGDNRDHSLDSRVWGFLPQENLKGKATLIWLSIHPDNAWIDPVNKFRWHRSFSWLQ
jgi:signal peptidase I